MGSKYCGVPGCKNNSRVNPELGFFTLPRDEALCVQWTTNMAISGPARNRDLVKVCGLHFEKQSFRTTDCKKLNRGAVPTILHQSDGIVSKELSGDETFPLVAEAEVSSAEPSQSLPARFLSNISKKEFVSEYRKLYHQKPQAKVLYFQILTELEKTIVDDNFNSFKKLSNLIQYISDVESPETLRGYYENVNSSIRSTNLVILACKHNKVKILDYIFDSDILNNISVAIRRTILPDDEDETHHNAFYYAIRSGNIKILDTLINKWPDNYFNVNHEKLDEILSRAYEELKLKDVPLSGEINACVVSQLINLRFFSDTTDQNKGDLNNYHITERINLILENIELLKTYFLNTKPNEMFLFVAKNIAQNIHILKHQLKSTYDRLPWEEIEFCLICFVSSYTKRQEINLFYHATLNKSKILHHLDNFAKQLEDEKNKNVRNIHKLANLPKLKREEVIAKITCNYPQFKELYNDYQQIRDIYSLEKINYYIKLALSADPKGKDGQLIITRALQVIGEFLKNTLESPKLSSTTSEFFLMSLPTNTRKIIIDLRNSISHANSLSKRIEIEENSNNFFINIQNDVKKVGDVVNDILYNKKIKIITKLLKKIVDSDSSDGIKEIAEIFNKVEMESFKIISENFKILEHEKLEKLIQQLSINIPDQTNYEKDLFNKINNIINRVETRSENIKTDYFTSFERLKSLSFFFNDMNVDHNDIRDFKLGANLALSNITPETEPTSLKKIATLSMKIFHSVTSRIQHNNTDEVKRIICEIFYIVEFETGDIKWIDELRGRLNEKGSFVSVHKQRQIYNLTEEIYNKQLGLKLSELKDILSNNLSNDQAVEKFACYKIDNKLPAVVEMLILDIMSILSNSNLENNQFFLDDNSPLLIGKCLRNHLAHDNALIDILCDPYREIMLNAKKLTEVNIIGSKKKIGKLVIDNPIKLRIKYNQRLDIITNQEKMFVALEQGNLESLKDCLKNGTDINARSINSWTTLHFAAKGPSLEVIKFIISQNLSVSVKDINNQSPLHVAAAHGRKDIVEFFVEEAGLCIDDQDINGKTPLHIAAQHGHKDTVEVLLKNKANTAFQNIAGSSPLHYAIRNNHFNVAKILLETDLNVDINEARGGFTSLHVSAGKGYLELVNFLIQNNANINARNDRDWTPLHAAALNGHVEVVNVLIKKGANVHAKVLEGRTTLHCAVENGHEEIANILVNHGVSVNTIDKTYNNTPLHHAARNGHEGIVKMLLNNQANASVANIEGLTPLHLAVHGGHLNIVTALLRHGVNINDKDKSNTTPLHYAAEIGHTEVAELLIKNKAYVNAKDNKDVIPLHVAALNGHEEVTVLLINNQAKINAQDITGRTPLHLAAMKGSKSIVDLLIKNKAEINNTNGSVTPLHAAVVNGHEDVIVTLIKSNAEVNARDNCGITPLHAAILEGYKDIVKLLITNKAQIDTKANTLTPLYAAIEAGHKNIIEILVQNGADVNVKCNNLTPLISAVQHNHKEIVTFLIENGANVNAEDDKSLSYAVLAGYKDIVEILLKNKARVDRKYLENVTPIHLAADRGHTEIVNCLIRNEAYVDAVTIHNTTPLFLASQEGHGEIVEILIANGANVNIKNVECAPLHVAAERGYNSVVEVLLNNGANINLKDTKNSTAVELAVGHGHLQVVKTILQNKELNINAKRLDNNWTVLHIAAQTNNIEIVKYLIDHGSDIHAKDAFGTKPIHIVAREGYKETVEYFLSKGSSINELGVGSWTLLHYAALKGRLEVVKYLLEQGADVNVKDANGASPLHIAANFGFKDVVEVLLKHGAVYNAIDKFCRKPLEIANDIDVINLLSSTDKLFEAVKRNISFKVENYIKLGAFVNAKNADGEAPLHYAACKGYHDIIDVLLRNKANPNIVGNKGYTALHYAAKFLHLKIVKALLSNGAVYNAVSDCGKTPSDLTVDQTITNLFNLVSESFNNIKNNDDQVVENLNKIKDIDTVKAVMGARNSDNKTLVIVALHSKFSSIEQLKQVSQGDISTQISLGVRFLNQDNYQWALSILKRAYETRKEILGPNNPATLDIQAFIANVLYKQGTYQEALKIFEEIYQKQKEILGLIDKDTLNTRSSIALVLHLQGKDDEAYHIFKEVYQKQKDILGPSHSDTLNTHFHMAAILDRLGKYEEALNINRAVFEIRKKQLGPNNPATFLVLNNIAIVLNNQRQYDDALQIFKEAFEKEKMVLGINHSDTLKTLHNIAEVLLKQKKYHKAMKTYQEVFNIQKNVLGPNHPDTLTTQYNIANVLFIQGKLIGALKAFRECFEQIKSVFGPSHSMVHNILNRMEDINKTLKLHGTDVSVILKHQQKNINNSEIQIIQSLLKYGAGVNDKDGDGRTLLHYAVNNEQTAVVNTLLLNGADVTQVTNKGNTPLHTATSKNYIEIVEILLQHVPRAKLHDFINAKTTTSGATSLHVAAKNGYLDVTKSLLKGGAIFNLNNNEGKTPLDVCKDQSINDLLKLVEELFKDANNGNVEIINKLEALKLDEFEAVTNARNKQGNTLLQIAITNKHKNVASKLSEILRKSRYINVKGT